MTPNEWNDERVDLLVKMRSEGVGRRVIVDRLNDLTGAKFTLGAVVGKIDRLFPVAKPRLTPEEKVAIRKRQRAKDAARKLARRARLRGASYDPSREAPQKKAPTAFKCREVEAAPLHIAFADLEAGMCRYPYGDEPRDTSYCGQMVTGRTFSFCAVHMLLCTRPFIAKVAA